jgi:FkbM family methyltransferase
MKFYGQFTPPVDKVLYEKYFKEKKGGFFVECGAYDGNLDSCCKFFEESMDWKGTNIEASPRLFKRLMVNRKTSFLNLNLAMSNKNGIALFNDIVSPTGVADGNGSLTHKEEHIKEIIGHKCSFSPVEVTTIRFSDLVKEYAITHVDLMALDVEGHEVEAIEGMEDSSVFPNIMCVEYPFSGLEKIRNLLEKYGYKMDFTKDVNAFFSRI